VFQAEDGIRDFHVTGVQTCALPILLHMAIPLVSGGLFILILIIRGEYHIIAPACLIFYGLALVSGSHYTLSDVKWLGICEIALRSEERRVGKACGCLWSLTHQR